MKKKNENKSAAANAAAEERMVSEARARTEDARREAEDARFEEWVRTLTSANVLWSVEVESGDNDRYARGGVFDACLDFLASRTRDVEEGYASPAEFVSWRSIVEIFAFDFSYGYDEWEWDGESLDVNDQQAFYSTDGLDAMDIASMKAKVAAAFRDFLVAGALAAKRIRSPAYDAWADALTAFDYSYRKFTENVEKSEIERFVERVRLAAGRTCVDCTLARLARKKGKKRVSLPPPPRTQKRA